MKKHIIVLAMPTIFMGCVPQSDYQALLTENKELKTELEKSMYKAYANQQQPSALQIGPLQVEQQDHIRNKEIKLWLQAIEKQEMAERLEKEAERKAKRGMRMTGEEGIWAVQHYVDASGSPTAQKYICNSSEIMGTFSNTVTRNSLLRVKLLISDIDDISIKLYEYAKIPVKTYLPNSYRVWIQDKDWKQYKLIATNFSDRLSFDKNSSKKIHHVLMQGGEIQFKIIGIDRPTDTFEFELEDAGSYKNAFGQLKEM